MHEAISAEFHVRFVFFCCSTLRPSGSVWCFHHSCLWSSHLECPTMQAGGVSVEQVHQRSHKYCSKQQSCLLYGCSGLNHNCSEQSKGRHYGWTIKQLHTFGRRWDDYCKGYLSICASIYVYVFPSVFSLKSRRVWPMRFQSKSLLQTDSYHLLPVLWPWHAEINVFKDVAQTVKSLKWKSGVLRYDCWIVDVGKL